MINSDLLQRDLAPFSDPATELAIRSGRDGVTVTLTRDAQPREYFFSEANGTITARHAQNRRFSTIASLLASDEFANLSTMAAVQRRTMADTNGHLLEPRGTVERANTHVALLSRANADAMLDGNLSPDRLNLILIDGPAGVGKTTLIQQLASDRARRYPTDQTVKPILHVKSRGRRLTNLTDALAQATQLLRLDFTYDQIPVLLRHQLIVVAIDGFDELVDPDGYKDAWFALEDFLRETEVGGPIILAGRDSFFDEQAFLKRITSYTKNVDLSQIHLTTATVADAQEYLEREGWPKNEVANAEGHAILSENSYILRPFFLSMIRDAKTWSFFEPPQRTLRSFLIAKMIGRESDLLSETLDANRDLLFRLLYQLFEEIALDMSDNESDSIDVEMISLFVEYVFSDHLRPDQLSKLSHRAGSISFLELDAKDGRRRFRHSEISNFFLSRALIAKLTRGEDTRSMRRSLLGMDLQSAFQDAIIEYPAAIIQQVFSHLLQSFRTRRVDDRVRSNLFVLLCSSLTSVTGKEQVVIEGAATEEIRLGDIITPVALSDIQVDRMDVRGADIATVTFDNATVTSLIVDDETRFGQSLPNVYALQIANGPHVEAYFDPDRINRWLSDHAAEEDASGLGPSFPYNSYGRLLLRVCRRSLRQFYLRHSSEDPSSVLLEDPLWSAVEQVLDKNGRINKRSDVPASGPPGDFLHIIDARSLLDPSSNSASDKRIWEDIRRLRT